METFLERNYPKETNLNKQMCFYSDYSTAISLSMLSQTTQAVKGKKKKRSVDAR